jgi:hypothetical protein
VTFDFKGQYAYQVVRDQGSDDRRKIETADEVEIVRGVLSAFHENNNGAGFNKTKLVAAIREHGITKPRVLEILAAGVKNKHWRIEMAKDKTHSILYFLVNWTPEMAL